MASDGPDPSQYDSQRDGIVLLHLLDLLISRYPYQSAFYAALRSCRTVVAFIRPHIRKYVAALATAIRHANYAALQELIHPTHPLYMQVIEHYTPKRNSACGCLSTPKDLWERTLYFVLRRLREVVREDAWRVVRTAYREVTIGEGEDTSPSTDVQEGSQCLPMPVHVAPHLPTAISLSLNSSSSPENPHFPRSRSTSTSSTTIVPQEDVPRAPREPLSGAWLARTLLLDEDECTEEGAHAWVACRPADETTRKGLPASSSYQTSAISRGTTKSVKWVLYRAKR